MTRLVFVRHPSNHECNFEQLRDGYAKALSCAVSDIVVAQIVDDPLCPPQYVYLMTEEDYRENYGEMCLKFGDYGRKRT